MKESCGRWMYAREIGQVDYGKAGAETLSRRTKRVGRMLFSKCALLRKGGMREDTKPHVPDNFQQGKVLAKSSSRSLSSTLSPFDLSRQVLLHIFCLNRLSHHCKYSAFNPKSFHLGALTFFCQYVIQQGRLFVRSSFPPFESLSHNPTKKIIQAHSPATNNESSHSISAPIALGAHQQ